MLDDETFLDHFEKAIFTPAEWHHREHIKAAYLYLRRYPYDLALSHMRNSIRRLNATHNVPEEPGRGYHETMTQAWMRLVYVILCEDGATGTADQFYDQHPQLRDKNALRSLYSAEVLMSPRAKNESVEPDLAPLPQPKTCGLKVRQPNSG